MIKLSPIKPKKKRAISTIVGYVLLISIGLVMSTIVYQYLKSYVPKDVLNCQDGASLFIQQYSCAGGNLNITLKNNGRFNIAGYIIHGANTSTQKVATMNLANNFIRGYPGGFSVQNSYILFDTSQNNSLLPGKEATHYFNYTTAPKLIEITPVRFETYNNRLRFAVCSNAIVSQQITCN